MPARAQLTTPALRSKAEEEKRLTRLAQMTASTMALAQLKGERKEEGGGSRRV